MKCFFTLLTIILLITQNYAQEKNVIRGYPLDNPLVVNGTFSELRNNHFHSGVDFSTNKKIGLPVYAVEDGVVNRIKVSAFGFGKVVYLRHESGFTTVYAHLDGFENKLNDYVLNNQYKNERFDLELFPLGNEFFYKKGDIIGYTGNSGSSGGPHLHFEIKETESELLHNPFVLNMFSDIVDTQKPVVNDLWVYPKNNETTIQGITNEIPINFKRSANGDYFADKVLTNGAIGFGINSYDVIDNSYGKNGIYEIVVRVNAKVICHYKFDSFSYNDSRFVNYLIDYKRFSETNQKIQRLFQPNGFNVPYLVKSDNDGYLKVEENNDYQVVIEISDYHKNTQKIHVPVSYKSYPVIEKKVDSDKKYIDFYRDYIFEENDKYVSWKAKTFYEDHYLNIQLLEDSIVLHEDVFPVHDNIDLRFNVQNTNINKEKTFIGRVNGNKIQYFDTWKRENDFRIRTKVLGTYKLYEDLVPPIVKPIESKSNYKVTDLISLEISDELSGIDSFRGEINGKWALFEYDFKTKRITHQLKEKIAQKGKNKLILDVKDKMGNNTTFEYSFMLE